MAIIGFHFTKMVAEKKKAAAGKIKVSNNVVLTSVKEAKINLGESKENGIDFKFHYSTKYEPDVASIDLEGGLVFLGKADKVKEVLSSWEKEKKLPPTDVLQEVYNYLLEKCSVQALILGKDMQLPPHVALPKVTKK